MENSRRNRWFFTLLSILIIAIVIAAGHYFPKYETRIYGLGVFLLIDVLCWQVISGYTRQLFRWLKYLIRVWFWLPLALLSLFLVLSYVLPDDAWSPFFRIYFPGLLVVLFLGKFIVLLFLFLGELLSFPTRLFNRLIYRFITDDRKRFRHFFLSMGFVLAGLVSLLMLSGFFFWVYDFKVKTVEIPVGELPKGLDGMRIVQISDIHTGSWFSSAKMEEAFRLVNELHPDLIVFTGDMVNFTTKEVYPFEENLRTLHAPEGIFAILGNHDYGEYVRWDSEKERIRNNHDLENFYARIGWKLLKNSNAVVYRNHDSLALIGVENWSTMKVWGRKGDLKKALMGTEYIDTKILLTHDPTHWDKEVLDDHPEIQLTLSGHTHAMQMGWIGERYSWSPAEYLFPHWDGLYSINNMGKQQFLYVNPGLGHLGFPGRVGIRPEITLLILKKTD